MYPTADSTGATGSLPGQVTDATLGVGPVANASPDSQPYEHPLRQLIAGWVEKIQLAKKFKEAKFGKDASEAMQFFAGPYDFMYARKYAATSPAFAVGQEDDDTPEPGFRMTVNKVAEAVQIFGPVLYHRNPTRQVNPRQIPEIPLEVLTQGQTQDPMMQQQAMMAQGAEQAAQVIDKLRATLLQFYLNYTPTELNLKDSCRKAINEAIIKGMGTLWTEVYVPKGLPGRPDGSKFQMVGSFYDTVDNFLIDPDCEDLGDAKWIARKCVHPAWQVEEEYRLKQGSLRGAYESADTQGELNADPDGMYRRMQGGTADLVVYWKLYSKMGIGGRLSGVPDQVRQVLDQFGDHCFLVISENVPYPLNLPPEMIADADPSAPEAVLSRLDWPTPFWADDDWPVTPIIFHEVPRSPWPMSHFKPAMGELKFLNWAYSFMAGKIRNTCRDILAVAKGAGEEIKEALLHGKDLTLIEINAMNGTIDQIVQFLQHPQMNGDIWKVIQAVTENFEKRTGLTELVYGESATQMRSAQEASLKGSQLQIRPDDMAQMVEDAMTAAARKEAIAARWHLTSDDVTVCMGQTAAVYWQTYVKTADVFALSHQLEYRIEAGSSKKPNKDRDAANMSQAMQNLLQPFFSYAQGTGDVQPVNALIGDWAKSIDLDPTRYLLMPPPPPVPGGPGKPGGPGPGGPPAQGAPPANAA